MDIRMENRDRINKYKGWIAIYRSMQEHWLWEDKPFAKGQAFIDLVMMANHKDNRFPLGNELVNVSRGEFVTSEMKLMKRWGWSKAKTRAFLKLLQEDKIIIKKTDRKKTTISIVNYSVYQDIETAKEPQKDHEKTTKRPQEDHGEYTNNNDNNENKGTISEMQYQSIVNKFHELCPWLPKINKLTEKRKSALKRWVKEDGIDVIYETFKVVGESDFLSGRKKDTDSNWKATFDWIINPTNRVKILEGNYSNRNANEPSAEKKQNLNVEV